MNKDLTTSSIDRQNILNNKFAIEEISKALGIKGIFFENEIKFIKEQITSFYGVDSRTIERYLEKDLRELSQNGYEVLSGSRLKSFKLELSKFGDRNFQIANIPQMGIFNFRAFLNIGMLLSESERARILRSSILDIVIDTINAKTGGSTKYINQRDEDFILTYMRGEDYRKEFTDALRDYVDMGKIKYAIYTDKIYQSIFKENSQEYRQILRLHSKEKVRDTMYSEILLLISGFEFGFAEDLRNEFNRLGRKLTPSEVDKLYSEFEGRQLWVPQLVDARTKMASRDLGFRESLHIRLKDYIGAVPPEDFERFLGEKSMDLYKRLQEMEDVFKRLKDRG